MTRRMLIGVAVGVAAGAVAVAADPLLVPPRQMPAVAPDVLLPPGAIRQFGETRFRHPGGVSDSALSPDGKVLATAASRSVVLWDTATGRAFRRFDTESTSNLEIPGLAFSPDGARLAAALTSSDVFVWDTATGAQVKRLNDERGGKTGFNGLVAFTLDGRQLVIGRGNGTEFLDTRTWKVVRSVSTVARLVSPVGPTLIGHASKDGDVFLADLRRDGSAVGLKAQTRPGGLAVSPDGGTLATFSVFGWLELWSIPDGRRLRSAEVMGNVSSGKVAFAPDGRKLFLATGSEATCWDVASLKAIATLPNPRGASFTGMYLLPDGETLLACASDGLIRRYHWRTGKPLAGPSRYTNALRTAGTADGRRLVVGDGSGRVDVWDTTTGARVATLAASGDPVVRVAFAPDGRSVAVARSGPGLVEVLDAATGRELARFRVPGSEGEPRGASVLAFSPDGRTILAATPWGRPQTWDVTTGTPGWAGEALCRWAFAPDGRVLACSPHDPALVFLDPATGGERHRAKLASEPRNRGTDQVTAVAFSSDSRRLAVATGDGRVRLCDPETGAERAAFPAVDLPAEAALDRRFRSTYGAEALAFSADGKWLLVGEPSGAIRLWEVETRQEARRLTGHERWAMFVAFGPDGDTALSAGADGSAYQWSLGLPTLGPGGSAWHDLAAADAAVGYRAAWTLIADPGEAVRVLRAKLPAAVEPKPEELARLIGRLDSDEFATREAATRALTDLGPVAAAALRDAVAAKPTAEARERITKLLERMSTELSPADRRAMRAALVLERVGTAEARALLTEWAAGAPAARLTQEAKASLVRLRAK